MIDETSRRVLLIEDADSQDIATLLQERGHETIALPWEEHAQNLIAEAWSPIVVIAAPTDEAVGRRCQETWGLRPGTQMIALAVSPDGIGALPGVREVLGKPCDIDLLDKALRTAQVAQAERLPQALTVRDVMVPLSSFHRVHMDEPASKAIKALLGYLQGTQRSHSVHDTLHRSVLVEDHRRHVVGVLTFTELLRGLQPVSGHLDYARAGSHFPHTVQVSSWSSLFPIMVRDVARRPIRSLLPERAPAIGVEANLMEATNQLLKLQVRRLLVRERGEVIGVVREQDLILEIANLAKRHMLQNSAPSEP